jgi:hypothetical protein
MRTKNLIDKKIISMILFMAFLIIFSFSILAFPPLPTEYYGSIIANETVNTTGLNVTAYDKDGVLCGYFTIVTDKKYGLLSCLGDDNETTIDEGADMYENITFYVNGTISVAFINYSWESGRFKEVNLSMMNYPPYFLHNVSHWHINETFNWVYKFNASDINYWQTLTYYDNTTLFDIDPETGLVNFTPVDADVGNHSVKVTVSDGKHNTSVIFNVTIYDVNNPPILSPIGNQIAVEGQLYTLQITATDADNDTLTYSANTSIFTINPNTGLINFTPTISQIGNYSINISVSDGNLTDWEVIIFEIVRGPYCGDGLCSIDENCLNCPEDCGPCPVFPGGTGGDGGDGGTGGTGGDGVDGGETTIGESGETETGTGDYEEGYYDERCDEKWECTEWNKCPPEEVQTRTCVDVNKCGTTINKPEEEQTCVYEGTCFDGIKNCHDGLCEEGIDCGGPCPPCPVPPSCFDGIQNCHDGSCEEGIDCGGPCDPCEIRKEAELPSVIKPIIEYPWLLWLLILIIITMTTVSDHSYVRKITKKEFKKYRKLMIKYSKKRKKIYATAVIASCLILIYSFYVFSLQFEKDFTLAYIGTILTVILGTLLVIMLWKKLKYDEKRMRREERRFLETDKRKTEELIRLEEETLLKLERKIGRRIYDSIDSYTDDKEKKDIVHFLKDTYRVIREMNKERKDSLLGLETTKEIKQKIKKLTKDRNLKKKSNKYDEFKLLLKSLRRLNRNIKADVKKETMIDTVEEFLFNMVEFTIDKHIMLVIRSDKGLISLYNELVDIYDYYKNQFDKQNEAQDNLVDIERKYRKQIESMAHKASEIEKISGNLKLRSLYNGLVDLYDSYKKKEDLVNDLKQIEMRKKEIT